MNKYYLYRHTRPDKNEPFYIGIGTKTYWDLLYYTYTRANSKRGRNKTWKGILDHNDGKYEVEIMLESNDYLWLKKKEVEFVALYGRIIKNTGILSNYTEGGDGTTGWVMPKEQKKRIRETRIRMGYKPTKETVEKIIATRKRNGYKPSEKFCKTISEKALKRWKENPPIFEKNKIYQYDTTGKFLQMFENGELVELKTGFKRLTINKYCRGHNKGFYKNFFWYYEDKGFQLPLSLIITSKKYAFREVLKIDKLTGKLLEEFRSMKQAGESIRKGTSTTVGCIREVCIGGRQNEAYGFFWKFKDEYIL